MSIFPSFSACKYFIWTLDSATEGKIDGIYDEFTSVGMLSKLWGKLLAKPKTSSSLPSVKFSGEFCSFINFLIFGDKFWAYALGLTILLQFLGEKLLGLMFVWSGIFFCLN